MILSVSIDLDPLWCYRQIYGLSPPGALPGEDPVTSVAVGRFLDLSQQIGFRGTIFLVGRAIGDPASLAAVQEAHRKGHELANHTWSHRYDLSRLSQDLIAAEVAKGADAVLQACGERPRGFRAPGYLLGPRVLQSVVEAGAAYDSSVLPSPIYQGIKAAAMGVLWILRRTTGAVLGDIHEAFAPDQPYRPDPSRPFRRGAGPLLELPITTVLGVPLIGSVLAVAGPRLAGHLAAAAARKGFVNLELHGLDLMDLAGDRLDPVLGVQRDLKIPWQRKVETFATFIETLLQTHRPMPLLEAATLTSS